SEPARSRGRRRPCAGSRARAVAGAQRGAAFEAVSRCRRARALRDRAVSVVIGTRGSALALAQAKLVASRLGEDAEIRVVRTAGDRSEKPIRTLGDGAFVATIEEALLRREIDVAVHSLKDLPTAEREG